MKIGRRKLLSYLCATCDCARVRSLFSFLAITHERTAATMKRKKNHIGMKGKIDSKENENCFENDKYEREFPTPRRIFSSVDECSRQS